MIEFAGWGHAGDVSNPLDAVIPVSRLFLTDAGYSLDGRPLRSGHAIELRTSAVETAAGWLRGRFSWSGNRRVRPMILSAHCGIAIAETDEVRWAMLAGDESRTAGAALADSFRPGCRSIPRAGA